MASLQARQDAAREAYDALPGLQARQDAAREAYDALPGNAKNKLTFLLAAVSYGGGLAKVQRWWEENQGSLDELGITVDSPIAPSGRTALFFACMVSHVDTVRYLVGVCAANVDARDFKGETPLIVASMRSSQGKLVRALLELGADPELRDFDYKMTALEWARERNCQACVEILEEWVTGPTVKSASKS